MYSISNDHQPNHYSNTAVLTQQQANNISNAGSTLPQTKLYPYTAHVMALQACIPLCQSIKLPAVAERLVTPLKLDNWIRAMAAYPDPQFVSYIASGIQQGFWVGFQYGSVHCSSAKANAKSASLHPEPISAYLKDELKQGRIAGPFPISQLPDVQCNKLGVIPKSTPGEW